ncbi:MAG TPA: hypothetical protein VEB64_12225 [Azospirillaceae bacterium]|nr:hypothetical protein [Azospirillaceae bacterium]
MLWTNVISAAGGLLAGVPLAFAILAATGPFCPGREVWGFWGALAGFGGGLVALVIGAFLNFELNRRRDDRKRAIEEINLVGALEADTKIEIESLIHIKETIKSVSLEKIRKNGVVLHSKESRIEETIQKNIKLIDPDIAFGYFAFQGYAWSINSTLSNHDHPYSQHQILLALEKAINKGDDLVGLIERRRPALLRTVA